MQQKTELIVLNTSPFKDNAIILHCLSHQYGRMACVVRIGKAQSLALFRPLNILEAELYKSRQAKLWTAKNFVNKYKLVSLRENIFKTSIALFLAEILFKSLKEGLIEQDIYNWCNKQIVTLDNLAESYHNFHIRFLLEYCGILGFLPNIQDLSPFTGENNAMAQNFLKQDFKESMLMELSGNQRNSLCENILKYIEYHTECHINIKSLPILRELFC